MKHVASSDLHVLHREFCFLYKEGNAPSEQGERPRGDTQCSQRSELQLERSQLRARLVCATRESRVSPCTAHRAPKQRREPRWGTVMGHSRAGRGPHLSSPSQLKSTILLHSNPSTTTTGTTFWPQPDAAALSLVPQEAKGTRLQQPQKGTLCNARHLPWSGNCWSLLGPLSFSAHTCPGPRSG